MMHKLSLVSLTNYSHLVQLFSSDDKKKTKQLMRLPYSLIISKLGITSSVLNILCQQILAEMMLGRFIFYFLFFQHAFFPIHFRICAIYISSLSSISVILRSFWMTRYQSGHGLKLIKSVLNLNILSMVNILRIWIGM